MREEKKKRKRETLPSGQLVREKWWDLLCEHPPLSTVSHAACAPHIPIVLLWFSGGPADTSCRLFLLVVLVVLHQGRCWMPAAYWALCVRGTRLSNVCQKLLPRREDKGEKSSKVPAWLFIQRWCVWFGTGVAALNGCHYAASWPDSLCSAVLNDVNASALVSSTLSICRLQLILDWDK